MKRFGKVIFFCVIAYCTLAQNVMAQDTIQIMKGKYYFKGQKMKKKEVRAMIITVPEADENLIRSSSNAIVSYSSGLAGAFLISYNLFEYAMIKNDAPWYLSGLGLGLIAVAIPFEIMNAKRFREAVKAYNTYVKTNGIIPAPSSEVAQ